MDTIGAHAYGISIHAPHAGSDRVTKVSIKFKLFQSTLPMRGAI